MRVAPISARVTCAPIACSLDLFPFRAFAWGMSASWNRGCKSNHYVWVIHLGPLPESWQWRMIVSPEEEFHALDSKHTLQILQYDFWQGHLLLMHFGEHELLLIPHKKTVTLSKADIARQNPHLKIASLSVQAMDVKAVRTTMHRNEHTEPIRQVLEVTPSGTAYFVSRPQRGSRPVPKPWKSASGSSISVGTTQNSRAPVHLE